MMKKRMMTATIVSFLILVSMSSIVSADGGTPGYISESDKLVEVTIQGNGSTEKIIIAKEGNWFKTIGGTSIKIPTIKLVYNGVNSVGPYTKNGKTITINSTVGDHQDYEVNYPYTTHSLYLPTDNISVTLDASSNFSNYITYFYLVKTSPTELKNAFADMVDGNSQTFRNLLNKSVWNTSATLDSNGDVTLNIGNLSAGDYVLVAMFNQTGDKDLHILSATVIEVLDYASTLTAPSSAYVGDILQATMTLSGAPSGNYRFGGALIHEDAYSATLKFTCEGNKSSTKLTADGVSLAESWKIAGVGLSNVNASIAKEKIEGIIGANKGSVVYKTVTSSTSQTLSFVTSGLESGKYILSVGVWDSSGSNRLVAFAQKEINLMTYTPEAVAAPAPSPTPTVTPSPTPAAPVTLDLTDIIDENGVIQQSVQASSSDEMLTLSIPEGTRALVGGEPVTQITIEPVAEAPEPPSNAYVVGTVYDLGPDGATFDPPITLKMNYDPESLPEGVSEENLVIAYYDRATAQWIELETTVDTATHTLTATVSHFTEFAALAKTVAPTPTPTETVTVTPTATPTETVTPTVTPTETPTPVEERAPWLWIAVAVIVLILVAAIYLMRRR
jgi:methanogen extracellular protein (TIGR04279 family)